MIGVVLKDREARAARELFHLFRTPMEFYVPGKAYQTVLVTTEQIPADLDARVLLIFNSEQTTFDHSEVTIKGSNDDASVTWDQIRIPLYGRVCSFMPSPDGSPLLRSTKGIAGARFDCDARTVFRIGYDLFAEVHFLLSEGQPLRTASVPTLELHIALIRECLCAAGIPFVEILSAPAGFDFSVCLTHDVDFVGIKDHWFDHTMWGFLWRSTVGSVAACVRGRMNWSKAGRNVKAALALPLVYLGVLKDFWLEFDRYAAIERGLGSTFFFIPFPNRPGMRRNSLAPKRRAAKYDLRALASTVKKLVDSGCEVGLHGLDAWCDEVAAGAELNRIREVTGDREIGVRMHWLYYADESPKVLERAGLSYDSTFGYNETVGFRAGTGQVFSPMSATHLVELPLMIQDTALFYPDRLGLSESEAFSVCDLMIEDVKRFGGVLTINWHTRSLSPERLWDDFYERLLEQLKSCRAWFAKAEDIVNWYRNRRDLIFDEVEFTDEGVQLSFSGPVLSTRFPFVARVFHPRLGKPLDCRISGSTICLQFECRAEA